MTKVYAEGIDISEWQGDINLASYKPGFVIIRAGYGTTEDKQFRNNVNKCISQNIPFGVYLYSYALSDVAASYEADFVLNILAPYKDHVRLGVWFDMEDADHYKARRGFGFNSNNISAICAAFCSKVEAAGYYTGIYTSQSWLAYLNDSVKRYDRWVASWGSNNGALNNDTSSLGTLHQYTSKPLDKNVAYVPLDTYDLQGGAPQAAPSAAPAPFSAFDVAMKVIRGEYGNGNDRIRRLEAEYPGKSGEIQKVVNGILSGARTDNMVRYIVRPGDTLWAIARKYNTTIDKIVRLNGIQNPNLIYAGQNLRVL